jgi:hypothetical protein
VPRLCATPLPSSFFAAHRFFIISEMCLRPAALIPPRLAFLAVLAPFSPLRSADRFFIASPDFREVTSIEAPMEDMRRCATTPAPFSDDSKRIIVAPQAAIYGVARMYQTLGEEVHPNIYVVKTMEEAIELLFELSVRSPGNPRRA